jgi:hypothetical protein
MLLRRRKQRAVLIAATLAEDIGHLRNTRIQLQPLRRLRVILKKPAVKTIYPTGCSESFVVHVYSISAEYKNEVY